MGHKVGDIGFLVKTIDAGTRVRFDHYSRPSHTPAGEPILYGDYTSAAGSHITALGLATVIEVNGERSRFQRWSGPEACIWLRDAGYPALAEDSLEA